MGKRREKKESVDCAKNADKNDLSGFKRFRDNSIRFYIRHCGDLPVLKNDEVAELVRQMRTGENGAREEAREKLIKHNIKLVFYWAKKISDINGMDINDAIEEGMFGLLRSLKSFDPARGVIVAHAGWWIRQKIWRAYTDKWYKGGFRLPVHAYQQEKKIIKQLDELKFDENEDIDKFNKLKNDLHRILSTKERSASLNASINNNNDTDDDDSFLIDFIPCDRYSPEREILDNSLREAIIAILNPEINKSRARAGKLNSKEWHTIDRRFGLTTEEPETLEKIGETWGLTRERVRQIEKNALKKTKSLLSKNNLTS